MIELQTNLRPPLNQFVQCLWYSDGESRCHKMERLLPMGTVEVLFKLREDRAVRIVNDENDVTLQCIGGAVVSGAYTRHFAIDTSQPSPTIGVHFRPGGAAPFLDIPLSKLMNQHVGLEHVWGSCAADLRERLIEASSTRSRFAILEGALLDQLIGLPDDYPAIIRAARKFTSPTTRVQAVRDSLDYRAKRFIRLFHDYVGMTPKVFCRIQRFQFVLDRIGGGQQVEWAKVALASGYYDQSHLIRDFRTFAGVTPAEYQPVEPGRKNHVALNS